MRDLLWRAALAAVLCLGVGKSYRWATLPEEVPIPKTHPAEEPFKDIYFGQRWYDGAQYGYRHGIIRGMSETEFGAGLTATRAMAATMVWRMAGEPEVLGRSAFQDVEPEKYYTMAVTWGETQGLWEGYGDGTFRPDEPVTWTQLELILKRYVETKKPVGAAISRPLSTGQEELAGELTRGELAETLMELREGRPQK